MSKYVHGYTGKENKRLFDQAVTLTDLFHEGTRYKKGSKVLEAGCGVGAQTKILAKNSPGAHFTSIDISGDSLKKARKTIKSLKIKNVRFEQADILSLPFKNNSFDHIFVCFVLEHLKRPQIALKNLKGVLKKGGTITVIEGDHGTSLFSPYSDAAMKTILCLIEYQRRLGGDSLIGRKLYPVLKKSGFKKINVIPRPVYADSSLPDMVEGFTKKTYIAMVKGVREASIKSKMISKKQWEKGIKDLKKTSGKNGVFYYTFFKAAAIK